MAKLQKQFEFTIPITELSFGKDAHVRKPFKVGELKISGLAYCFPDEDYDNRFEHDIDEVIYTDDKGNSLNVIGLLKFMGDGSIDELDFIHKPTIEHVAGFVFGKENAPIEAKERRALKSVQRGDFSGDNLFNAIAGIARTHAQAYVKPNEVHLTPSLIDNDLLGDIANIAKAASTSFTNPKTV